MERCTPCTLLSVCHLGKGTAQPRWVPRLREILLTADVSPSRGGVPLPVDSSGYDPRGPELFRDLAASVQTALEDIVLEIIGGWLPAFPSVQGVVMTGGCALNVKLNAAVQRQVGRQ